MLAIILARIPDLVGASARVPTVGVGRFHARRMVELNHAIDSPRWRMREWRRRLRQPLRMRRNRRMFFIEFLEICRGWLSPGGCCLLRNLRKLIF